MGEITTMFGHWSLIEILGPTVVIVPALLLAAIGLPTLADRPLTERTISFLAQLAMTIGLAASVGVLALMLIQDKRHVSIDFGNLVEIPASSDAAVHGAEGASGAPDGPHFRFALKFVFDRLSVPFAILTFLLCGTISAFAAKYLHREPGFNRFFVLYALFALGMIVTSLAETVETLFTGWELVGISSALLVAFFQERQLPVRNGLRVWSIYRISDAALLLAAIALHDLRGAGDFAALMGEGSWPDRHVVLPYGSALVVGMLLIAAAAGKSALIPFCGWLPRAMEGPTPSSAIFYGSLSVHLGAFLLLRFSPILDLSLWLSGTVVVLGLSTALLAALTARAQTDIKSALAFASLTQVGLIVAEIGIGLRYIALIHILGHACLRTLQFLRAPNLLHDYHQLENALGEHLARESTSARRWLSAPIRRWLYRLAVERGYLDAWLADYVARPVLAVFGYCDALERRWTDFLSASPSRQSDKLAPSAGSLEEPS